MKSSYVALNVYIEIAYDGSELMSHNNLQVIQGCSNEFPDGKRIAPWEKYCNSFAQFLGKPHPPLQFAFPLDFSLDNCFDFTVTS